MEIATAEQCFQRRQEEETTLESWIKGNSECANLGTADITKTLEFVSYRLEQPELLPLKMEWGSSLDYSENRMVANQFIKMYIHLERSEIQPLLSEILAMERLLVDKSREIEEPAYMEKVIGFKYILTSMKLEAVMNPEVLKAGILKIEDLFQRPEDILERAEELSAAASFAIYAIKYYFIYDYINHGRTNYETTRLMLKQLIRLNPGNPEWHVARYLTYKHEREAKEKKEWQKIGYYCSTPSKAEIGEIHKAKDVAGSKKYAYIEYALLVCLARTIRSIKREKWSSPLQFGKLSFTNVDHAVEHLKKTTKATVAKEMKGFSASIYCKMAGIYYKMLPRKLKEYELAKELLEKAIKKSPNSRRPYHRLGLMSIIKAGDLIKETSSSKSETVITASHPTIKAETENAVQNLEKAHQVDGDLYILNHLLWVLLGYILQGNAKDKFEGYLPKLVSIKVSPDDLDKLQKCKAELNLLYGIYHHTFGGHNKTATLKILQAETILSKYLTQTPFEHFHNQMNWFLWSQPAQKALFLMLKSSIQNGNSDLESSTIVSEGIKVFAQNEAGMQEPTIFEAKETEKPQFSGNDSRA